MGATQLEHMVTALEEEAAGLVADDVAVPVAARLAERCAAAERVLASLRVRLARRVTEAGGHRTGGDRDATGYLARLSGSSRGKARAELELAERLGALPEVARAFEAGRLSTDQAQLVARAAAANPGATGALLATAAGGSFAELRQAAARAAQAVRREEDEVERERRCHARRYCRTSVPADGGLRIDALLPTVEGAKLLAALTQKTDELLAAARAGARGPGHPEGPGHPAEPVERLRADALIALCDGGTVRTELLVRVDAAALVRGERAGEETCEVAGLGPVSVATARSLLGEAFWTLLVQRGADITTVTSTTRAIPRKVRKALEVRDPCCCVPGCGTTMNLEIDHWRDFADDGLTELANLRRLCRPHHWMKTAGLLRLEGGPGNWYVEPGPCATGLRPRAGPGPRAGP